MQAALDVRSRGHSSLKDEAAAARETRDLSAQLAAEHLLPAPWADALASLQVAARPLDATEARWAQIKEDALRFALSWHDAAGAHGWQMGEVFGLDLDPETGGVGLILDIRGGRVVLLDRHEAMIKKGTQYRFHRRRPEAGRMAPVWELPAQ